MDKANKEIRELASQKGVYLWQLAGELGITDATLSRWLRKELSKEMKIKCIKAIDLIAQMKRS